MNLDKLTIYAAIIAAPYLMYILYKKFYLALEVDDFNVSVVFLLIAIGGGAHTYLKGKA
jgi:hypothetical protein